MSIFRKKVFHTALISSLRRRFYEIKISFEIVKYFRRAVTDVNSKTATNHLKDLFSSTVVIYYEDDRFGYRASVNTKHGDSVFSPRRTHRRLLPSTISLMAITSPALPTCWRLVAVENASRVTRHRSPLARYTPSRKSIAGHCQTNWINIWWQPSDLSWWGSIEVPVNTPAVQSRRLALNAGLLDRITDVLPGNLVMRELGNAGLEPGRNAWSRPTHGLFWEPKG